MSADHRLEAPPDFEVPEHRIDREIYAMPAFTNLPVRDLDIARAWYEALGFVLLAELGAGPARLLHLRRYRYQDLLLVPAQPDGVDQHPAGPRARTCFGHTGPLEELDEIAAALTALGTGTVAGPQLKPWHAVELDAVDADGHQVSLTARADTPTPPELLDELRRARGG